MASIKKQTASRAASAYIALGLRVVPQAAGSKVPTMGGFGPTSNPETWADFCAEPSEFRPSDGIAILCGPCPAGEARGDDRWLCCLDLDGALTRADASAALGARLPRTLATHKRKHLWYWVRSSEARAKLKQWNGLLGVRTIWEGEGKAPDLDVKWCGGYAREVGAVTEFDVAAIADLPRRVLRAILAAPGASAGTTDGGAELTDPIALPDADVEALIEALIAAWPAAGGGMHDAAKALGGALRRVGAPRRQTRDLARAVLEGAGSDAVQTRVRAALNAWDRADARSTAYGRPKLTELLAEGEWSAILDRLTPAPPEPAWALAWRARSPAACNVAWRAEQAIGEARTEAGDGISSSGAHLAPGGVPWIVQKETAYWIWSTDLQSYHPAVRASELGAAIAEDMAGLMTEDDRTRTTLDSEWIRVARGLQSSYTARRHTFDPTTRVMHLAALRWADRPAKRHAHIDRWFRALFAEQYNAGAQWLASLFDLRRPSPCLYLWGNPGMGKGLLSSGLAAIWSRPDPGTFDEAIADFNAATGECPLVFADEGLPAKLDFNRFRKMVTQYSRRVRQLYTPAVDVTGCGRFLVVANDTDILAKQRPGTLTPEAISAIAQRLLVIECGPEAAAEAAKLDTFAAAGHEIAEHVAWLASTIELRPAGERFAAGSGGALELLNGVIAGRSTSVLRYITVSLEDGGRGTGVYTHSKYPGEVWISVPEVFTALQNSSGRHDQAVTYPDVQSLCTSLAARRGGEQHKVGGANRMLRILDRKQLDAAISKLD